MKIVVGGIIKKDEKILLIQEGKESCYGMWNIPAGRLEKNEYLTEGAIREIKEETGLDADLTGIIQIGSKSLDDDKLLYIIFEANVDEVFEGWSTNETLTTKFFTQDEIINMKDKIRSFDLLYPAIKKCFEKDIISLNVLLELK